MSTSWKGALAGLLGLSALVSVWAQPQTPKLDAVVDTVKPFDATRWIGWGNGRPSALYLLPEGAKPQPLGELPGTPSVMVVGGERVLWLGEGYAAVAPLQNPAAVEITPVSGSWTLAVGNATGFVKTDTAKLAFSNDGKNWRPVATDMLSESTSVTGLAADGRRFVVLLDLARGDEANHMHSILAVSEDGLKWESTYFSEPQPGEPELTTLAYGNGRWMAYGVGSVYGSTDGREWTPEPARRDAMPELRDAFVYTGGGEWWAVDWRDRFEFSADGLDWSAEPQYLHQLSKGSGSFWVVGSGGMRNLALDAEGKLRVATVAALRSGATPPPASMVVAKPAAPTKPAAAPSKLSILGNEELAKQWAQLDVELQAETTMVGFSRKLAELSVLFSRAADEEVRNAVRSGALIFVLQKGDAACLAAFKPALNEKSYADAQLMLQKGLEAKRAIAKGQPLPAVARGKRAENVADNSWDIQQMRLHFLNGNYGSAYDFAVMHNGVSLKKDQDLSFVWTLITQVLIPGTTDFESAGEVEKLLAAGSGVAAGNAVGTADMSRGEAGFTARKWELIEQASSAGLLTAKRFLDARDAWRVDPAHMPEASWPPEAFAKWDEATQRENRSLFDRHVAFSRDVMAFRAELTPGVAPDRAKWQALLARHQSLLKDPDIHALREAYVQSSVAMALLYTSDTDIGPSWLTHMKEVKAGLAAVAINPDLWNFRARLLQWSGQLEEARRDAAMAVLMLDLDAIKTDSFFELLSAATKTLQQELSLPESVLAAPQHGIVPYNLSVTKRNGFMGNLVESDHELIIELYANFGARLRAAWALPDAEQRARVEAALWQIHGGDVRNFNYPEAAFDALRQRLEALWVYREREPRRALNELEALVAEAAHPFFLVRRARLLGAAGQRESEVNALNNILSVWPTYKPATNRLAELRADMQSGEKAAAAADYQKGLDLLNQGERAAGRAALERAAASEQAPLSALLLLAELQANPQEIASAEATLRRAVASYPDEPTAAARLGMFLVGQRKIEEARAVIKPLILSKPKAPETQAVQVLIDTLTTLNAVPSAGPTTIQQAVTRLEELKSWRFTPEVHGILAQFKMMQRDQAGAVKELVLMANGKEYVPPEMWFQIGQLMRNMGNADGGKGYIEKAAALGLPQAQELLKQL